MGYFSNSTDGHTWEQDNCPKCVHHCYDGDAEKGCPILQAHFFYQDDEGCKELLEMFIPRDGVFNGPCSFQKVPECESTS